MPARLAIVLGALLVGSVQPAGAVLAAPSPDAVVLAQQTGGAEEEAQGQESTGDEGSGQGSSEAESGAQGQSEEGESTASEVPWTFQMARLSVLLLLALAAGIGLLYYRLVVKRQRGQI
jgi:hypothetical protein